MPISTGVPTDAVSQTMSTLHLFNPANDSALASGSAGYSPPAAALHLQRDLALLPAWWASPGDFILVDGLSPECPDVSETGEGLTVVRRLAAEQGAGVGKCEPWGWSRNARHLFSQAGVDAAVLPSDGRLDAIRELSHRRITVPLCEALSRVCQVDMPVECFSVDQLPRGDIYIKIPYSSSGRGVMRIGARERTPETMGRLARLVARHGSIMAERALDKVEDLAALFYSDGAMVRYRGLSLFSTTVGGAYTGNLVAPESLLRQRLGALVSLELFDRCCSVLESELSWRVAPHYIGWMGVDMLVYRDQGGACRLAPCLELNLRRTMGVVCHNIRSNDRVRRMSPATFTVGGTGDMPCGAMVLAGGNRFAAWICQNT